MDADSLKKETVAFPECVFLFGADLDCAGEEIRALDRKQNLGLGCALSLTPPHWVHLPAFAIGKRMVSNGEYLRFLQFEDEGSRVYDGPDIWDEIWTGQNFRIGRAKNYARRLDGGIEEVEEFYGDALNFVDAYIASIRYEVMRLLELDATPISDKEAETRYFVTRRANGESKRVRLRRGAAVHRLFACIKRSLKGAVLLPGTDERALLTPKEAEALADYNEPARIIGDIDDLIGKLRSKYGEAVDPRLEGLFASGKHRVETILFLERFRESLERHPGSGVPLHEVLYPRYWPTPEGKRKSGFVARSGRGVPWEDLPVVGITLYEALGYALWMASLTGEPVGIPNEAEYERAASWPLDAGEGLDKRKKDLFPWQGHRRENFHAFFGRVGEDLETFYGSDRAAYEQLLEDTSRPVGEADRLYMLEGYGWHWTSDRLDDGEIRYSRFRDPGYRRYREDPEVFDYRANTKMESTHFVLKGSPEILGGPGVTPRRYSAFPLRGYENVGFRIAVR